MVYKTFDKKVASAGSGNGKLVEELHKLVIKDI